MYIGLSQLLSTPADYVSALWAYPLIRTAGALLTAIRITFTLTPSEVVRLLLWAQLTPTYELFIARFHARWASRGKTLILDSTTS